jgi:hypothetical protein
MTGDSWSPGLYVGLAQYSVLGLNSFFGLDYARASFLLKLECTAGCLLVSV